MTTLSRETCTACHKDATPASADDIHALLPQLPEWQLVTEENVPQLHRHFRFPDFTTALAFVDGVGELAESSGHHPRIVLEWGRVDVAWWTHAINGLHRNDFIMAAKTDYLYDN